MGRKVKFEWKVYEKNYFVIYRSKILSEQSVKMM